MNLTVRSVATALSLGFAVYFAARGLWWTEELEAPLLSVLAIAIYIAVTLVIVLIEPLRAKLPLWGGALACAAAVTVPLLASLALAPAGRAAPFATWYIGGIGLLSVICIVRRRWICGWVTLVALSGIAAGFLGMAVALQLGLVGSIMWAVVAQLLVMFWDRAVHDTERLADIQRAVSTWHATQQVRQRERRVRVQYALKVAGPVLSRVVASDGVLSEAERLQARLAEGRLRDELRGATLLNDSVRTALEDARRRGVAVTVFDEGGLEDVPDARREQIRDELAEVLRTAESARVIIRAARDPQVAVTVVGRDAGASEEDSVALWREIPR